MMKIYLAGPMRGEPDLNHAAFDRAARRWRDAGHAVRNPAQADRAAGIEPGWTMSPEVLNRQMARNMNALSKCDAVALLPGWERSSGTVAEVAFALALDPPRRFFDAERFEPIAPPTVAVGERIPSADSGSISWRWWLLGHETA